MIRQFTYTASPWGASGPGWMVFQQSKGVSNDEVKSLYPSFQYDGVCAENGAGHFTQFVYQPGLDGNGAVLSQTIFTGMRWWGEPRPGDFFAHVMLADDVALAATDFNPFCLYRSPDLQTAFPEALKDKALKIYRHETPYEKPPELPTLTSFAEVGGNDSLRFDAVLKRVSDAAIQKLGMIVSGILHRPEGAPLAFDCTCAGSLDVWTLAFHLCPVELRRHLWLAVGFSESAFKRLPNYSKFVVYGTKRKNAGCDPTTGLYDWGKLPNGKLAFRTLDDVARFKEMLDGCGERIDGSGFDRLVDCWRVLACDEQSVSLIREASAFIKEHEKVAFIVRTTLMDQTYVADVGKQLRREQLRCVARYELGLIEDIQESSLEKLAHDGKTLEAVLDCLGGSAKSQFLGDLYRYAQGHGTLTELAKAYLAVFTQGKCIGNISDTFLQRVWLFARIRKDSSSESLEEHDLTELRKLNDETRGLLAGLADSLARMEYKVGLSKVKNIDSLEGFLSRFTWSAEIEKCERDVVERLKPGFLSMTAADICKMVRLLEDAGMSGAQAIESILQTRQAAEVKRIEDRNAMRLSIQENEWGQKIRSVRIVGWLIGALTMVVLWAGWQGAKHWLKNDDATPPCRGWVWEWGVEQRDSIPTNETQQKTGAVSKVISRVVPCEGMPIGGNETNYVSKTRGDREKVSGNRLENANGEISCHGKKEEK